MFPELKDYIGSPPFLSKLKDGETLYIYLVVFERAVSDILVREENRVKWLVYYVSKTLLDGETRYSEIEKLSLALVVGAKKSRHI